MRNLLVLNPSQVDNLVLSEREVVQEKEQKEAELEWYVWGFNACVDGERSLHR